MATGYSVTNHEAAVGQTSGTRRKRFDGHGVTGENSRGSFALPLSGLSRTKKEPAR